jgi:hypothetical protein
MHGVWCYWAELVEFVLSGFIWGIVFFIPIVFEVF